MAASQKWMGLCNFFTPINSKHRRHLAGREYGYNFITGEGVGTWNPYEQDPYQYGTVEQEYKTYLDCPQCQLPSGHSEMAGTMRTVAPEGYDNGYWLFYRQLNHQLNH